MTAIPGRLLGLPRGVARRVRAVTYAQGAGESGLGRLIELHAVNAAGDALIAVSLAGTLFFSVPIGQARGRVALYLLITMAPFLVMAPIIGPLLDHFRRGRRYALSITFAGRAALAWVMAAAITGGGDPLSLYPAAFGCLVLSKAYGVTRQAGVPRVLPPGVPLVKVNSRVSLAGTVAGTLAGAFAGGLVAAFGGSWSLRLAVVVMAAGAVLALRLDRRVDSNEGERSVRTGAVASGRLRGVGPVVAGALRANAALRAFSGFLTLFVAFLLRAHPTGGVSGTVGLGLVVAGAAIGGLAGTAAGALLRERAPEALVVVVLGVTLVAAALGAWLYGLAVLVVVAFVAGTAQALGKQSLDSLVQREVPESVRSSVFARSESVLQLAWVLGGGLGIALPLNGTLGFGLAAAGLLVACVVTVRGQLAHRREAARPRVRAAE
jgi:MFS family permease